LYVNLLFGALWTLILFTHWPGSSFKISSHSLESSAKYCGW